MTRVVKNSRLKAAYTTISEPPLLLFPETPAVRKSLVFLLPALLSCDPDQPESFTPGDGPNRALARSEASVYWIQPGETLTDIARQCGIWGGYSILATWNRIEDPDSIRAFDPLLVPRGTDCGIDLQDAEWPRFDPHWRSCEIDWQELDQRSNESVYAGLDVDQLDALSEDAYDTYRDGQIDCAEPMEGLEICERPHVRPGLQLFWQGRVVYEETRPRSRSASGAADPAWALHDLDGDGDDELIYTQLIAWSMGISLPSTRLLIFEDPMTPPVEAETLFYESEHWLENGDSCDLLDVRFERLSDPYLSDGNYFSGMRRIWVDGVLAYANDSEFPAQRLTDSFFESTRGRSVLDWFIDGDADAVPMEYSSSVRP
jgi:hypothetical protein